MKLAALLVLGACVGGRGVTVPARPAPLPGESARVVLWSMPMLEAFGQIADTATIEHLRCLLGTVRGDTVYVVAAWEPVIAFASKVLMAVGPCPDFITLGTWHNHLPRTYTLQGEDRGQTLPLAAYCQLSLPDRRVRVLIQVISVTAAVSCAWSFQGDGYVPMPHWPPRVLP